MEQDYRNFASAQAQAGSNATVEDTLASLTAQTSDALAEAIRMAHQINHRLAGPRPEAIPSNMKEPPHPDSALYAARVHRDAAQELMSLLGRAVQSLG